MDVKEYNAEIREKIAELKRAGFTDYLLVTSLHNRVHGSTEGRVVEVSIEQAGKLLAQQTHRVATEQEIATFKENAEARRKEILAGSVLRIPSSFRAGLRK
jgi:hypothetical protein